MQGSYGYESSSTESALVVPASILISEKSPPQRTPEDSDSRKLPSSRFKGVVPQPNGRWGAQIYEKHRRIWLGTFNDENEAAKAYDTAAQRFRGTDAVTNFKPLSADETEMVFLNCHSKDEIVDMLRKHTYHDELQQSRKNYGLKNASHGGDAAAEGFNEELFEKAVTPSDVGKLNRLVIPKQYAEKHFPLQNANNGSTTKGILLNFEDMTGKVWRFRYSYWNSSQSYVLTKGWSRFVKEKGLRPGDVVSFRRSTGPERQLYIDWKPGQNVENGRHIQPVQMVRLFGVNIFEDQRRGGGAGDGGGKRIEEMELFGLVCSKKHRIINVL